MGLTPVESSIVIRQFLMLFRFPKVLSWPIARNRSMLVGCPFWTNPTWTISGNGGAWQTTTRA